MKKIISSFVILLMISSCGWHLRGTASIPKELTELYITAVDSQGELMTEMRQLLKKNHIAIADDSDTAIYEIKITDEIKDKRTSGVGNDALSSAYEITFKAEFEIHIKNNNKTKAYKSTAVSVRSFNYTTASINSAAQEEILLEKEMRRDLAQQMLLHLSAVITHPNIDKTTDINKEEPNGKTAP